MELSPEDVTRSSYAAISVADKLTNITRMKIQHATYNQTHKNENTDRPWAETRAAHSLHRHSTPCCCQFAGRSLWACRVAPSHRPDSPGRHNHSIRCSVPERTRQRRTPTDICSVASFIIMQKASLLISL